MTELYDFLLAPYATYRPADIILEALAVILGIFSVVYSKKNNVLVYPTGIAGTLIYIYLAAFRWQLYGDAIINAYYFYMSIYGWYLWSRKDRQHHDVLKITVMDRADKVKSLLIFVFSVVFVSTVYVYFNNFIHWWAYVDTFITGLFFVGMWLLARRKAENWLFLIAGDIIAIPLFFLKGYALTGLLYIALTIIAIFGYLAWKKILRSEIQRS